MKITDIVEARNPQKNTLGLGSKYNYQQALAASRKRGSGVIKPEEVRWNDGVRMGYVDQGTGEIYDASDL